MNIYVVRHGKTIMNEQGLIQGTINISLSELGIKQANETKESLKDIIFDLCISSPLKRAVETAKIIVDNKCKIITDDRLLERVMGTYEGKKHTEYAKSNYWDLKLDSSNNGVEKVSELFKRVDAFLKYVKTLNCKNVLLVSHAATIRVIHYIINGYNETTDFLEFKPKNAAVYEYKL